MNDTFPRRKVQANIHTTASFRIKKDSPSDFTFCSKNIIISSHYWAAPAPCVYASHCEFIRSSPLSLSPLTRRLPFTILHIFAIDTFTSLSLTSSRGINKFPCFPFTHHQLHGWMAAKALWLLLIVEEMNVTGWKGAWWWWGTGGQERVREVCHESHYNYSRTF